MIIDGAVTVAGTPAASHHGAARSDSVDAIDGLHATGFQWMRLN
jgi:hypothetical protein